MCNRNMKMLQTKNRGTSIERRDVGEQNWAGDSYRKIQKERLQSIGQNLVLHLGRGVRTTKLNELPEPRPRKSTAGMTRSTNRGTSSRKSKNHGNSTP